MIIDEITYKDRSEFLRGFATIIRKNNCGHNGERAMFLTIGKYFGFEKEFCEYAAENLLANKYISEHPAIFSNKPLAEFFISDVAKIMLHTNSMTDASKQWLLKTAKANKIKFNLYEFDLK
ncbi:MAG: hypothetical protein IPM56_04265 [Ignavibacteriales bacterium]|nr:MAG: hypothetical protein IPM56_04265 [Ignavibacteriales bacterium]